MKTIIFIPLFLLFLMFNLLKMIFSPIVKLFEYFLLYDTEFYE